VVSPPIGKEDDTVSLDVLWQPIKIGTSTTLEHRIIQSAHDQAFGGPDFLLGDKAIRYWQDRAAGGAALIITGAQTVHRSALGHIAAGSEGWRPEARERYQRLADAVHPHGTKVFVQLGHWGTEDFGSQHLWNFRELWAPSDVPSMLTGEIPRPVEPADIEELIAGYVATALNAQEGRCDGVEFHAAHGYLGMQFFSPLFNQRTDEYGGTTENRCRFAIQVATAIRERCGHDFVLGIRLSFDEMNPTGAGIDPDEGERIVRVLSATGLYDYFNVTGGAAYSVHKFIPPMSGELREQFVPYAERVKKIVNVPVFMAGRVTDIRRAAALVAAGKVDVVAMTRAHIADPELVSKARSGRIDEIRECAGINQGCINRVFLGREMSCTQNATVGREAEWGLGTLKRAESPRQVMVVGGGPAGMKAAEVAASRGHEVVLYERENVLGGQVRLAAMLPTRTEWGTVIRTQERAMHREGVKVELGVDVTQELIDTRRPDVVVMATGSRFATSGWSVARGERASVPGLEENAPLTPGDVLRDPDACGEDVLILEENSGYTPLGLAELLADRGRRVRVVSRSLYIGEKTFTTLDLPFVYPRLAAKGVVLQAQTFVESVNGDGTATLMAMWSGATEVVAADSVVVVMGRKPVNGLYRKASLANHRPVHRIGDCVAPRDVDLAFYEGERMGRAL